MAPLTARAATYTAGTSIDVPSFDSSDGSGPADPYATNTITVSGFHGKVSHLSLSLLGFSHENADDVDMLLVGPTNAAVMIMSDAGGANAAASVDLTFDQGAAAAIPDSTALASGVFRPANYNGGDSDTFAAGPPAGPYGTDLSVFNNTDPNGTWTLYVMDDTATNTGSISDWSLQIDGALHAVPAGTQADRVAHAILSDPSTFVSASWDDTKLDASSTPDGYATPQGPDILFDNNTATLAGFPPLPSTDFAILTTGDANLADDTPQDQSQSSGVGDGGTPANNPARGDTAYDISTLRIGVNVPDGTNCLSMDYRFLSEEFPEFVGTSYNDAFIAEVDNSTWTTSGTTVSAPNDFATHTGSEGVTVNGVGPVAVSAAEASDTTYDAATGLVTTKTPITPGAHTVILSIFDQGDPIYDSAAFVDNLKFINESPDTCKPPAVAETPVPPPPPPGPPPPSNAFTVGSKIVFKSGATVLSVTVPGPGVLQVGSTTGSSRAELARARATATKKKKKPALIKAVKVTVKAAGTVKVTLKPTAAGKKVLKKKGKLRQRVRITFKPTGGTANSTVKTITIKRKVKKK